MISSLCNRHKRKFHFYALPLTFIVLFSSCGNEQGITKHNYYIQNVQQTPLFKEKNEFRLYGAIGGGTVTWATSGGLAYSITPHLAVMSNLMSSDLKNNEGTSDKAIGNYFDFAGGYFKDLKDKGVLEVYGGVGACSQSHSYHQNVITGYDPFFLFPIYRLDYMGSASINYLKWFIQPDYGISFNAFDLVVSTKLTDLYFSKVSNRIYAGYPGDKDVEELRSNRNSILIEPSFTIRGGWKYVKLQFQYAYTGMINSTGLEFDEQHISIGIFISLAKRFANNKEAGSKTQ